MTPRVLATFESIKDFMINAEEELNIEKVLNIAHQCSKLNKSEIVDLRNAYDAFRREKFPQLDGIFAELFPTEVRH